MNMEKNNELLQFCRYYKGEDKCPFENEDLRLYWDLERVYVKNEGKIGGEKELYQAINGKTYSGIPYELLMVFFTSWAKGIYDIKANIANFYAFIDDYLFVASDYIAKDKLANQ